MNTDNVDYSTATVTGECTNATVVTNVSGTLEAGTYALTTQEQYDEADADYVDEAEANALLATKATLASFNSAFANVATKTYLASKLVDVTDLPSLATRCGVSGTTYPSSDWTVKDAVRSNETVLTIDKDTGEATLHCDIDENKQSLAATRDFCMQLHHNALFRSMRVDDDFRTYSVGVESPLVTNTSIETVNPGGTITVSSDGSRYTNTTIRTRMFHYFVFIHGGGTDYVVIRVRKLSEADQISATGDTTRYTPRLVRDVSMSGSNERHGMYGSIAVEGGDGLEFLVTLGSGSPTIGYDGTRFDIFTRVHVFES
jgi:hypothetical protein